MAEAVGLVASIGSLVQIAGQITKLSYSYVSDIKSAPTTQKHYLREVSALTEVLFRVETAVNETKSTGLDLPSRPPSLTDEALHECHGHLKALHLDLDKRLRRLLWPFQEKEIRRYIDLLHGYRTLFSDFLSTNILVVANATYRKVAIIDKEQATQHLFSLFPLSDAFPRSRPIACSGTGDWFLRSKPVQSWCSGPPSLLWFHGSPGVGKTLLASTTIAHLWAKRVNDESSVVYIFCQFSSREQQLPEILRCMIRQIIEQADEKVLLAMKQLCTDPAKQNTPAGLAELFTTACQLKLTYLIIDGLDEIPKAVELLCYLPSFVEAGCKVMISSRDLSGIRKRLSTAIEVEVSSQSRDLELYIESRFQDSDFPTAAKDLTQEITEKSSNVFLHVKLILDELMDLTTIRQMRKALEKKSTGLEQAYQSILQRIDDQAKAKRQLALRFIGWITFARRRLELNEIIHAFAVERDGDEIDEDNMVNPDLLLQSCVGLVILHDNKTVGLCHATAYDFFRSTLDPHDTNIDIAETCLRYMCLNPFRKGPCTSALELSRRFHDMSFLTYASRHWGEYLQDLNHLERGTESLVKFLIIDKNLRDAAVQALHFRHEFKTDLLDAFFESIPAKQTALHVAAYWNLTALLRTLIQSSPDISLKDTQGWTALHYACANGHLASSELLVEGGADINSTDNQGWTPLFWASFTGSLDIVHLLLANNVKYTKRTKSGYTALHWAISRGETEVVRALLHHHRIQISLILNADIRTLSVDDVRRLSTPAGIPLVSMAAETQNGPIFDLLVEYLQRPGSKVGDPVFEKLWSRESFKVKVADGLWRTWTKKPRYASDQVEKIDGRSYVAKDPNRCFKIRSNKKNPLAWNAVLFGSAIRDGHLKAARLLIETGVDVNFVSEEGSPLHIAACQKDSKFVQLLLEHGAKPALDCNARELPLHVAICRGNLETAKALLTADKVLVNYPCQMGNPLHAAASQKDPRAARLLLENGANPENHDPYGRAALHIAVMNGFIETACAIIDGGAEINQFSIKPDEIFRPEPAPAPRLDTCLMLAVLLAGPEGEAQEDVVLDMVLMLLSRGADPRLQNSTGETALHIAAMCGNPSIIALLMAHGSTADIVDRIGRTPIHTMMQFADKSWVLKDVKRALSFMLERVPKALVTSILNRRVSKPIYRMYQRPFDNISGRSMQDRMTALALGRSHVTFALEIKTFVGEEAKSLDTALSLILRKEAWAITRLLISFGADISAIPQLQTILRHATRDLDYRIMKIILDHGVCPDKREILTSVYGILGLQTRFSGNERDQSPQSPPSACSNDGVEHAFRRTLATLTSAGVDVNFEEESPNTTPLLLAAERISMGGITGALLEAGADAFYACKEKFDPVLAAAVFGNIEPLRHLTTYASKFPKADHWSCYLSKSILSDSKGVYGQICDALQLFGNLDCQNSMGRTLLHLAAMRGNTDLVVALLGRGAHANIPDEAGWLPIHHIGFYEGLRPSYRQPTPPALHDTLWHLLPINIPRDASNPYPYRSCETGERLEDEIMCRQIAGKKNPRGNTMLTEAWFRRDEVMFSHLLELEDDVNSSLNASSVNSSLLHAAVTRGFRGAMSTLLARGASIEALDICGCRPLHAAAQMGDVTVVEMLIHAGANVSASAAEWYGALCAKPSGKEWKGQPLHIAVKHGHIEVVELLLKHGADVTATADSFETASGMNGCTALHISLDRRRLQTDKERQNHLKIASLLMKHGASVEGVVEQLQVEDIPHFEDFDDLWDKIRGYTA